MLRPHSLKKQQGVVIVIALFIVALVAAMASTMMVRMERDTRRTSLILRNTQAEFYAQGSIAWAIDQLRTNWEKQKKNQLIDVLPLASPTENMNGFFISSTIHDLQARFNINNLINPPAQADFKKLLRVIDPDLTEEKAQALILAIVDWIQLGQNSEFTKYYAHLPVPYLAPHKPMVSTSELQLVKGITPALYTALQPYVVALPTPTLMNVQTASPVVLASLSQTMTLESGRALVAIREQQPFVSNEVFLNSDIIKNHPIAGEKFTVVSSYFLVETHIAIEKQELVLYTLLERIANQDSVAVNILWQSKGIW